MGVAGEDFLVSSPFIRPENYRRRKYNEQPQQHPLMLYCLDYVFRVKAKPIFEDTTPTAAAVFEFFVLDDLKFDEFFLFENIWRETLIMNKFYKDHLQAQVYAVENQMQAPVLRTIAIKTFGQMPGKVVFRQIEEASGITLEDYIAAMADIGSKKSGILDFQIEVGAGKVSGEQDAPHYNPLLSKKTLFSELEAIDVILYKICGALKPVPGRALPAGQVLGLPLLPGPLQLPLGRGEDPGPKVRGPPAAPRQVEPLALQPAGAQLRLHLARADPSGAGAGRAARPEERPPPPRDPRREARARRPPGPAVLGGDLRVPLGKLG